ncbi:MAG: ATP-binding protein [Kofleriaceae bacterium]
MTPPHSVFFDGPAGYVELAASPYDDAGHHLEDRLALCGLQLQRAAARLAPARPSLGAESERAPSALDAQLAERRRWIDGRVDSTARRGGRLPLIELAATLELSDDELDVVTLLLSIELDARGLATLAEGGTPPIALTATSLWAALAPAGTARSSWLRRLAGPGSLLARGVVLRMDDPGPPLPLAAAPLRLCRSVLAAATGARLVEPALEGVLREVARMSAAAEARAPEGALARLVRSVAAPAARGVVLWITGGADGLTMASAVAEHARRPLVAIDLRALARETPWARARLLLALHLDQRLRGWIGLLDVRDGSAGPPDWSAELRALEDALAGPVIAVSDGDVPGLAAVSAGAIRQALARPTAPERNVLWSRALAAAGAALPARQVAELADAFPMNASEIEDVVASAHRVAQGTGGAPGADTYRSACLARQHARLGRLADLVPRGFGWQDLVLPEEELERLREILERQRHRHTVFSEWDMISKLPYGSGIAALFSGPPGTGKTMAASVVAAELDRQLYRVDLSRVVDKYIGETEKNLGRIFDAAADADALLLFDEADSLFGKRTQVQSSHDRYANLETNYLLQRIEQHPGISILTTNHVQNIDEAFARRIPFRVEFPFPDGAARAVIWSRCFAEAVPREPIDFARLGEAFELSGGHIKSAVVRASFMAASAGTKVSTEHLRAAALRELESMGKLSAASTRW